MTPPPIRTLTWFVVIAAVACAFLTVAIDSGDAGVPNVTPRALMSESPTNADAHALPPVARGRAGDAVAA